MNTIAKAIIPVAGLGTRLLPLTAAVPKALMPLPDAAGRIRAVIHHIVAEALSAADEAALVVSPGHLAPLRRYFDAADALVARGGEPPLGPRLTYLVQDRPAGFGDAVALAETFAAGGAVLVMLGDHVHRPAAGAADVAVQVARAFAELPHPSAVVGMQDVDEAELCRVGVARGEPVAFDAGLYRCAALLEKPTVAVAREQLATPGLPPGRFLAHAGIYDFAPDIFRHIAALRSGGAAGEVQLTAAQELLLAERPGDYYLLRIAGRALDMGTAENYLATWAAMAPTKSGT